MADIPNERLVGSGPKFIKTVCQTEDGLTIERIYTVNTNKITEERHIPKEGDIKAYCFDIERL